MRNGLRCVADIRLSAIGYRLLSDLRLKAKGRVSMAVCGRRDHSKISLCLNASRFLQISRFRSKGKLGNAFVMHRIGRIGNLGDLNSLTPRRESSSVGVLNDSSGIKSPRLDDSPRGGEDSFSPPDP
jgi:hypothetical protein